MIKNIAKVYAKVQIISIDYFSAFFEYRYLCNHFYL